MEWSIGTWHQIHFAIFHNVTIFPQCSGRSDLDAALSVESVGLLAKAAAQYDLAFADRCDNDANGRHLVFALVALRFRLTNILDKRCHTVSPMKKGCEKLPFAEGEREPALSS